jgi:hypothetical protein
MYHHKIDQKYALFIQELKELIELHRKSTVEFRRKDSFIICQDDYSVVTINIRQIKESIKTAKEFMSVLNAIVGKNERILGRSEGRIKAC